MISRLTARGATARRSARRRAFSVLELTVASGILVLILALTLSLLIDAQARIGREGRRALDAVAEVGLDRLRGDLRASRSAGGIGGAGGLWSSAPLELSGHPQGGVSWELVDGDLRRVVFPPGSLVPSSTQVILRGVASMRWRSVPTASRALEIELTLRETARLGARSVAAGQRESRTPRLERYSLVLAPRNVSGRTSW